MAYKYFINRACANRDAALEEIHTRLQAMGWTYVDGIVPSALDIPAADVDVANDTFTKVGHGFTGGEPVYLQTTVTAPGGITKDTTMYYVVGVSGSTFKLSATFGGSAVNISSQGSGVHSIKGAYRIYSSNSENGDKPVHYIRISGAFVANTICIRAGYKYVSATREFSARTSLNSIDLSTSETGFYLWMYGDKDFVVMFSKVGSTYSKNLFGFLKPFHTLITTLASSATSGLNAVLEFTSSAGFEVGYSYQIMGMNVEGRDSITITAINGNNVTVSNLPRNYAAGALIGIQPCLFGNGSQSSFYVASPPDIIGLEEPTWAYGSYADVLLQLTAQDPDYVSQKYILQPLSITNMYGTTTSFIGVGGYQDDHVLLSPSTGMVIEDTFVVGRLAYGQSSGSNSTTQMNDTSKAWTINEFQDKVVVISFGAGAGQIKKIASNDATSITLSGEWIFDTLPDNSSQYIICEEGYRYMTHGSGAGSSPCFAVKEGI